MLHEEGTATARQPADLIGVHPLSERVQMPLMLSDVKVTVEGVNVQGKRVRLVTSGTMEFADHMHASLLDVYPIETREFPDDNVMALPATVIAENYLVLAGRLLPDDEGAVYRVEEQL